MRRVNTSHASLAISIAALFVALGGTAWAVTQIGTKQIKNNAVTGAKLHNGAVTSSKLANNAVSSGKLGSGAVTNSKLANGSVSTSKIQNGAVTASQVAPNTFLPATGQAADSARLGGLLPADFINGVGFTVNRRLVVPEDSSSDLFGAGFGSFTVGCSASGDGSVTWKPTVSDNEYMADVQIFGAMPQLVSLNGIGAGGTDTEPNPATLLPFMTTYQIGYTATGEDHILTMVVTGRFESGTGCVFVAQELSTG